MSKVAAQKNGMKCKEGKINRSEKISIFDKVGSNQ